ncbi:MAG: GntR family transcriptional regulator, partial [Oscillospiraceae bacterium]|nr:GntR family transcriptional regulator [Oscillospiraceae bacterium]
MEKKYKTVMDDIKRNIAQNLYDAETPLSTEMELAGQYGFSRETIHKAMTELVREGLIYRIPGKGTFITEAAVTDTRKPPHFFVVLVHKDEEMFKLIRGIEHIMDKNACMFSSFFWTGPRQENVSHADDFDLFLHSLSQLNPQGIFCYPRNSVDGYKGYEEILNTGIPLILLDKEFVKCTLNCVVSDNYMGMYRLTQHVIDKGHTKIGYLSLDVIFGDTLAKRRDGFLACLNDNGIPLNTKYIKDHIYNAQNVTEECGDFIQANPEITAIICANDFIAEKCYPEIAKRQIAIPDDLSVCSFDGYEAGQNLDPPLTAMRQNLYALGEIA